jgi:branched-chain amino acid transport system permease protein
MNNRIPVKGLGYGLLVVFLFLIPLIVTGPYNINILVLTAMNIILVISLRLISLSGQLSLAHGGMMAVGAYTSTLLVIKLGVSSWLSLLAAGLSAAIFACIVGFPFVKLKGIYFSMVTLFLAEMVTLTTEQWRSLTGGTTGITSIPRPDPIVIPGLLNITFSSKVDYYYLALIMVLFSVLVLYAVERSRVGLTFRGIQQADRLAESVGVNTAAFKVLAFGIGCFFAGLTGGFYAQYITAITPDTFGFLFMINIVVYMIVGGVGRFAGPILGAFILTILPEIMRPLKEFQPFFFAGILMLIIFFMPEGLVGLPGRLKALGRKILRYREAHA